MKRGVGRVPKKTPGRICNPPFFCKSKQGISAEGPLKRGVGRVPKKTQGVIFSLSRGILQWNFGRGAHENGGNRAKTEACFYDINVTKAGFFAAVGQLKYNRGRRGGGGERGCFGRPRGRHAGGAENAKTLANVLFVRFACKLVENPCNFFVTRVTVFGYVLTKKSRLFWAKMFFQKPY